jgi:hypothetical protein
LRGNLKAWYSVQHLKWPTQWNNYRESLRECKKALKRAERSFINNTTPYDTDRSRRKQPKTVLGLLKISSKNKAEILVNQFKPVFTKAFLALGRSQNLNTALNFS